MSVVERGTTILDEVDLEVPTGAHTVLLGPNGAGKTTVLRVIAGHRFATRGTVDVLGHRVGRVDLRTLRRRIGVVSDALDGLIVRRAAIRDLVAAAMRAVTAPTARDVDTESLGRADAALDRVGMRDLADRRGVTLSAGEWQRALLARALVVEPDLLLLDEPCVGLDLAQRARFLGLLDDVLAAPDAPTCVLVTHHLEEVPTAMTRATLLRDGRVAASGEIGRTLTSEHVHAAYDVPVTVHRDANGRWSATAGTRGD